MVKHDILLPIENNQEEINQILNNIYEIDKKIKEYYHYINEYNILIESFGTFFPFILYSVKWFFVLLSIFSIIFDDLYSFIYWSYSLIFNQFNKYYLIFD